MTRFEVGDQVTAVTTVDDPPHLVCYPATYVVDVDDDGSRYWIGHRAAGNFPATRFGPFPGNRLRAGW